MPDIVAPLIAASGLIEKGGIVGVLLIFISALVWEVLRLRKTLTATYRERDKARMALIKCRAALDFANIKVDLSDVADLIGNET